MEALLRTARLEAFSSDLVAFLILIATILIRSASSSRWSARSTLEHLLNILILHARASIVLALQKLTLGWVETASRRYIIAPSTDRLNARWLLLHLLAILLIIRGLRDLIRSAATSDGSSLGREELFNILVLHLFAQEVLVVALKELCLGRIQTARHISNGRMAGLSNYVDAFGFLLLLLLVVCLVLLITLDSTAANAGAGIDIGGSFGLNG